ncbi:hypothetical protein PENSPDRAFT_646393 [Peniophora sp. CONT]|nr:hypothetical protein PENSPDRAFT_646393 [Peniophora sp. CONT]
MAVRTFGKSRISSTHLEFPPRHLCELLPILSRFNYHKSSGASASGDVAPLPPVPLSIPSL